MDKLLARISNSIALRLILSGVAVIIPVGLSTGWLGAGYQQALWGRPFVATTAGLFLSGTVAALLVGFLLIYPIERWVIGERAKRSWRWVLVRLALWTVAGLPMGGAILLGIRLGVGSYPAIVESTYFVMPVVNSGTTAILYTFLERAVETVQRREATLKNQIAELRIEIDQMRVTRQVAEITETAYFEELRSRAKELRKGK